MSHSRLRTGRSWIIGALLLSCPALAQVGGGYDLSHNVVADGGATFSTDSTYTLGGTIGQADAGALSDASYVIAGGFWGGALPVPTLTPTSTPTQTVTRTPTNTATVSVTTAATPTQTRSASQTNTPMGTPTPTTTFTATATLKPTPTATLTPKSSPTVTPTSIPCAGDCNVSGGVTVDDLVTMVDVALGNVPISTCMLGDANQDGQITVDEILSAVNQALLGCP